MRTNRVRHERSELAERDCSTYFMATTANIEIQLNAELVQEINRLREDNARLLESLEYESLASALVKTGIVQEEAIECPCAYDDYKTQDAIHAMADILSNDQGEAQPPAKRL